MVFIPLSLLQESMIHLATAQLQSCMHAKISCWRDAKIRLRLFRNPPLEPFNYLILTGLGAEQPPSFFSSPSYLLPQMDSIKWGWLITLQALSGLLPSFSFQFKPFTKAAPLHLHLYLYLYLICLHAPFFMALQNLRTPASVQQIN